MTDNPAPSDQMGITVREGSTVHATGSMRAQRVTTADLRPVSGDGILSTARSHIGQPQTPMQITPDSLVMIQGREVKASIAESLGLIRKSANGYEEASASATPPSEAVNEASADMGEALPSTQTEAVLSEFANRAMPGDQVRAVQEFIAGGEVSEGTISRAASQMGLEPAQVQKMIGDVTEGFRVQAAATMSKHGITDADVVFEWARQEAPEKLRDAMRAQAFDRSTAGYAALAKEYVSSLDVIDPDTVMSAQFGEGITAVRGPRGVLLNIEGFGQVPYRIALQQGLIKVGS